MLKEKVKPVVITCIIGTSRKKQREVLKQLKGSPMERSYKKGITTDEKDSDIHIITSDKKEFESCLSLHVDKDYMVGHKDLKNGDIIIAGIDEIKTLAKLYAVMLIADDTDADDEKLREVILEHGVIGLNINKENGGGK